MSAQYQRCAEKVLEKSCSDRQTDPPTAPADVVHISRDSPSAAVSFWKTEIHMQLCNTAPLSV